ncbi:hypothetical protein RJ640_025769 [Escallonia rubra]|uniref:Uncharacterized protein n=1 Tax=Escallonia rubra TaxID=112253 RepID=A0AA88RMQ5_9ASTE|nr:hypothetical protein RJ640_025769 [Escallonia rubra]
MAKHDPEILSKSLGIISKTQRVKTSAWVKWVNDLSEWSSGHTVAFNGSHQYNLSSPYRQDALGVDQARVAQVVESTFAENLSSGLEPHCLAELDTIAGQQLGEDASKGSKHGPSGVNHLELTVLGEGFWVSRKPGSVPTIVTEDFTGKACGGLTGERTQVLDSVRAVPRAARGDCLACSFPHGDPSTSEKLRRRRSDLHCLTGKGWGRKGHC